MSSSVSIQSLMVAVPSLVLSTSLNAASIYLNDDAGVSVSLNNNGVLTGGSFANIINADSAIESDPHIAGYPGTHAYITGNFAQMDLRFDLGGTYNLQTAHLWNIDELIYPDWGVTSMSIEFFDEFLTSLGTYSSPLITSGGDGDAFAENFDLGGVLGVKYVDVLLTGGSDGVDITNFGFTTVSSVPVPAAVWLFGSGLLGLIGLARRKKA